MGKYVLASGWARELMAMPMGIAVAKEPPASIEAVKGLVRGGLLVSIGDVVTRNLVNHWATPNLAIIDYRTRRARFEAGVEDFFDEVVSLVNEPGTLSDWVIDSVGELVRLARGGRRVLAIVQGEEDLLAIPAVLKAPTGSLVLYGLYTGYLVAIPVNDEFKLAMLKLLSTLLPTQ